MYDEESDGGPKGTFEIYKAEADTLFKQGEYRKAIHSYTTVSVYFRYVITVVNNNNVGAFKS